MGYTSEEYNDAISTRDNNGETGCSYANEGYRDSDVEEANHIIEVCESEGCSDDSSDY